jgi:uncharacterized membrane protein YgdD (TMEM256/DUF423 family)
MVSHHDSSNDDDDKKYRNQSSCLFLRKVAGAMGASGVALGAIGAHAFRETLTKRGTAAMWQTATVYHLFHATAILTLSNACGICRNVGIPSSGIKDGAANRTPGRSMKKIRDKLTLLLAGKLVAVGTAMFSGSIYCLALNIGPKALLGPITPSGGLFLIGGWIVVGLSTDGQH